MADTKITGLTELTTPALADVIAIVDDPTGTPVTKKMTLANLQSLMAQLGSTDYLYLGSPTADGSWRIGLSAGNMVFQKRESSSWVTKGAMG